jgi:lysophospholipase L1-like esterase
VQDIRVAFIGDSFVNGTGDTEYLGWTGRVCQSIKSINKELEITAYNLGVRRETSSDIANRYKDEVASRLIDGDKSIVILSFGVNDCVAIDGIQRVEFDTSVNNLKNILLELKDSYDDILFVMPPPIADSDVNSRIKELSSLYTNICHDMDIKYIDIFDKLESNVIWQKETRENDGSHPRSQGYQLFANYIIADKNWQKLWR